MTSRRRALIGLTALCAAAAHGQGLARAVRVGGLSAAVPRESPLWAALEQRLREHGYTEGRNLVFEFRNAEGHFERLPALAAELVRTRPDVIVVTGPEVSIRAAKEAAGAISVVMIAIDFDPVATGLIKSLQRPGANMTGLSAQQIELTTKRLELIKETLPRAQRIAVLSNLSTIDQLAAIRHAAPRFGVTIQAVELGIPPHDYAAILKNAKHNGADALFVLSAGIFFRDRAQIAQQSLKQAIPGAYSQREFTEEGGLLAYGVNLSELFGRAADYVDRILKGASPANLPVEQPTKFELVINLKTAKSLGIEVPQSILLRADRLIE